MEVEWKSMTNQERKNIDDIVQKMAAMTLNQQRKPEPEPDTNFEQDFSNSLIEEPQESMHT